MDANTKETAGDADTESKFIDTESRPVTRLRFSPHVEDMRRPRSPASPILAFQRPSNRTQPPLPTQSPLSGKKRSLPF